MNEDPKARWLQQQWDWMMEEAKATKPFGMTLHTAMIHTVMDRYDRHILNKEESDILLARVEREL